jgi:predicted RND superfamily exporter protein
MAIDQRPDAAMPVVERIEHFDSQSGSFLERLVFNHRRWVMLFCILLTFVLGTQALKLSISASFEAMMPRSSAFIKHYQDNLDALRGLGNSVRVVVENPNGDIYDADYLQALKEINDRIYTIRGVDRAFVKSIWMPVVRWDEITPEGFTGGPVMPDGASISGEQVEVLRHNVARAGIIGSLVSNDQRSAMIFVPLMARYGDTGEAVDLKQVHASLERIRADYAGHAVQIHVIGFAQLVGDLIQGMHEVILYFALAALIIAAIIYGYSRCARSTVLVLYCSLTAMIWQLGTVRLLGMDLDPYSILVPFLVFAIGVSHGAQKMNGVAQDIGRGTHKYVAARYTFRRLYLTGLTALLCDAVGFALLMIIDIDVIRGLALSASIGVAALIFTNLILLPTLLSYTGVNLKAAKRSVRATDQHPFVRFFARFTQPGIARVVVLVALMLTVGGYWVSLDLKIGDLDPGAPELRPESRYNQDNAFVTSNYGLSTDQFAVIVKTPPGGVNQYETLLEMDRLEEQLRELPGVQTTVSAASLARNYTAAGFEGDPRWMTLSRDPFTVTETLNRVFVGNTELMNEDRSVAPIIVFLADHKADTLQAVVNVVQAFGEQHNSPERQFLLAAGSAGIEAATNAVVKDANRLILLWVYAAVIVLCYVTFRDWRAVVVAVVPLVMTSILCEALMVLLGIGVKVATLPVVALGVGIGVDYALYLLSAQLQLQRKGATLDQAYTGALMFTGKVVALIGITMAVAVGTWLWSPIKFQADMGILLTFMFIWNMFGALILIPALSSLLYGKRSLATNSHAALTNA